LKKEAPYAIGRLSMKWNVLFSVAVLPLMIFRSSALYTSFILKPTNSMKLYATGSNGTGRYGDGTTTSSQVFTRIGSEVDWTYIAPGGNHTLALKEDGSLYTTGWNSKGQLGFGDTTQRLSWTKLGTDSWLSIGAGLNFSLAVRSDGTLWAWGENDHGQLGQGTSDSDPHTTPIQVGTDSNWTTVKANIDYVIARKSDGTLWAWGGNGGGQLGQNYRGSDELNIVQIGTDTNWSTHYACGEGNAFGLKDNGWLYGWGFNDKGALGIGDSVNSYVLTPQWISGTWEHIGAGQRGATAIKSDGTLWAWGDNVAGQLGQGTTDTSWHPSPVQIGTDTDWAYVAHSRNSILAAKDDESIYGWGANLFANLGLGHSDPVHSPTLTFVAPKNDVNLKWDLIPPPGNEVALNWDIIPPPGNETYLRWQIEFGPPPPPPPP
jgi:alpha-tubulin suppressor-like RCC1 family protein